VPFPAAVEAFLLLTMFEIIRETGIRMPSNIGQALSIVGALVIGQAAVEAKLIAAPMIIIVSITAITGLLIPKLFGPAIIIRYMLLLLSSLLGLFGFIIGISFFLIHILGLKSFGVSQMSQIGDLKLQDVKDTFIRSPWQFMDKRTEKIAKNLKRLEIKEG
jgi:spore germination protein KA